MSAPLLLLRDIRHGFGGNDLLAGAELAVHEGARIALVGRNGSGKSTLLKIAAGLMDPAKGDRIQRRSVSMRYLPQEPDLTGHATVFDYVAAGLGEHDEPHRARSLLTDLGLSGTEDPATLSGGERRRAALARVLAPRPDILMLDEPTNHLDLPAIAWLERTVGALPSAMILISHDRRFLTALSNETVWLDRGIARAVDKGFGEFENWRDTVLEEEEIAAHKLQRRIAREQDWVVHGVSGRRKRNVKRMARLQALREEHSSRRRPAGQVNMEVTEAETSGKLVVELIGVTKAYGDAAPVVRELSVRIQRGERVGIVGPNGAGKTTLIKLLTGALPPDSGTVKHGAGLEMVALDQGRADLDPNESLKDALTRGHGDFIVVGDSRRHIMSYMKDFLFAPEQAGSPVSALSGGERARLMLARALSLPSNLLVLDEPTNDLDLETLDLLQEMIADYPGTVLLVSHDRDFLDRTVDAVIASDGDGQWTVYAGGYSDMVAQRGQGVAPRTSRKLAAIAARAAPASAQPPVVRKKFNFAQTHALKTLPDRIASLQAEMVSLNGVLADTGMFARDPKRFEATSVRLAAAQAELDAAETEWLELQILQEQISGPQPVGLRR
jgi:ATP-binding cassette subfamily F protein uup